MPAPSLLASNVEVWTWPYTRAALYLRVQSETSLMFCATWKSNPLHGDVIISWQQLPRQEPSRSSISNVLQADCHGEAVAAGHVSAERQNGRSDRLECLSCHDDPCRSVEAPTFMHNLGRLSPPGGDNISSPPVHDGMEG